MPHTATAERSCRAAETGCGIDVIDLYSPNGFLTGEKQQRIVSPIELLLRSGKIDGAQFYAADLYSKLVFRMMRLMPKLTQGDIRLARSTNSPSGLERRIHAVSTICRIHDAFNKVWWPALAWVGVNYEHGLSVADLGRKYYPDLKKTQHHANGVEIVQLVTLKLSDHFERNSYGSNV